MKEPNLYSENQNLTKELRKLERMMSKLRQEKEELAHKYNTLLESSAAGSNETDLEFGRQTRRTGETTRKLEDECNKLKNKIDAYQLNDQRQNDLVQRLQTKVLQYKEKADLAERKYFESKNNEKMEKTAQNVISSQDNRNLSQTLEEQENRNSALMRVNELLREQLEQGTESNRQLTASVQNMSEELDKMRSRNQEVERQLQIRERKSEESSIETHQQILKLWTDFGDLKNQFFVGRGISEREMTQARQEILLTFEKIKNYYENFANQAKTKQSKMNTLSADFDGLSAEHESLINKYKQLEERHSKTLFDANQRENEISYLKQMLDHVEYDKNNCIHEKNEILRERLQESDSVFTALKQISSTVLEDDEMGDKGELLASFPVLQNHSLPHKLGPFAAATVSVVSALNTTKQLRISELRSKLLQNNDKMAHLDSKVAKHVQAEQIHHEKLTQQQNSIDSLKEAGNLEKQENIKLNGKIKEVESRVRETEREKDLLKEKIESLTLSNDELCRMKNKLTVTLDESNEEKEDLSRNITRQSKEIERGNSTISRLEKAIFVAKEELTFTKELSDRMELDKTALEKQFNELSEDKTKIEQEKAKLQDELHGLKSTVSALEDSMVNERKKGELQACENDKLTAQLNKIGRKLSQEQYEKNQLETEIWNLKSNMMALEQDRSELEMEFNSGNLQIECLEKDIQQLERDLTENIREKNEIFAQFKKTSRKKNSLSEEIISLHNELTRLGENCNGIKREKDKLSETAELLKGKIASYEEATFKLRENLEMSETERISLERTIMEMETKMSSLSSQNKYFEAGIYEITNKNSALSNEINSNLKEKDLLNFSYKQEISKLTKEHVDATNHMEGVIRQLKEASECERKELLCEMERVQNSCNVHVEEIKAATAQQTAEQSLEYKRGAEAAKSERKNMQDMYEEEIVKLKSGKYETVQKLEYDKRVLREANAEISSELENMKQSLFTIKHEYSEQTETNKAVVGQLEDQILRAKRELDDHVEQSKQAERTLTERLNNISSEKEKAKSDVKSLQKHVVMLEDNISNNMKTISSLNSKLGALRDEQNMLTMENQDLEKLVEEEKQGKEVTSMTLERLKEKMKVLETERSETMRALVDSKATASRLEDSFKRSEEEVERLKGTLKNSEDKLMETNREMQMYQREIDTLTRNKQEMGQINCNLREKLERHVEQQELVENDNIFYRQNIADLEETLNGFHNNLNQVYRTQNDLEECLQSKNKEIQHVVGDLHDVTNRMNDDKMMYERLLQKSEDKNCDLTMSLSAQEGRLSVMEEQLRRNESSRRDTARKLDAICTVIRRFVGVDPPSVRARSSSPLRERRTTSDNFRGRSLCRENMEGFERSNSEARDYDILPFKAAILNFSKRLINSERSRDDLETQCRHVQTNLDELTQKHSALNIGYSNLRNSMTALDNEKSDLNDRLTAAQNSLNSQRGELGRVEREKKVCRERLMSCEQNLSDREGEVRSLTERIMQARNYQEKAEEEIDCLRKNLTEVQAKWRHVEMINGNLKEKVQQMILQSTEQSQEIANYKKRREKESKVLDDLTNKNVSLQRTVDNLSKTITKFERGTQDLADNSKRQSQIIRENELKIETLTASLNTIRVESENWEKDRSLFERKISNFTNQINDHKKENMVLSESLNSVENQLAEDSYRIRDLEVQTASKTDCCVRLKAENDKLGERMREAARSEERAQTKLKEAQRTLTSLLDEKELLEHKLERINDNFKKNGVERQKMCDTMEWLERNYERENSQLSQENRLLQTHINDLSEQIEFLEGDDKSHQMRVSSLQSEINELKSQLRSRGQRCIFNQSN